VLFPFFYHPYQYFIEQHHLERYQFGRHNHVLSILNKFLDGKMFVLILSNGFTHIISNIYPFPIHFSAIARTSFFQNKIQKKKFKTAKAGAA